MIVLNFLVFLFIAVILSGLVYAIAQLIISFYQTFHHNSLHHKRHITKHATHK
jgi:hypothetical protein